ncbi:hypothetical protein N0B51_09625 [Tsuneonella sp. YG55]|uniref:Uncharacterized protein n=1 Tax=Tsuneonella litorea TaxID=2976475 RepID=A0A9X2W291_9SPHN|nr:hypothetical protein [Tsuneonella litorea]MCT2559243.1 hypothetical protein [Tsuneonella litorea]
MKGRDLLAEMEAAASRVRLPHLERLRALGVPYESLGALGRDEHTFGAGRAVLGSDGLFQPDEHGEPVVIQAVNDDLVRKHGEVGLIDLIAWRTDEPARWWWRTGSAWALGFELLDGDEPVVVVATPCDWLAAAGRACCILDWSERSPAWPAMRAGPPLSFTNDTLRQRVRNALVATAPLPSMEIADVA